MELIEGELMRCPPSVDATYVRERPDHAVGAPGTRALRGQRTESARTERARRAAARPCARKGPSTASAPYPADVVLVVADTTLAYDRNIKLPRYAAAGVPEVWLLNLQNDTIEVNSEPESERYRKIKHHRRGQ